MNSSGKTSLTQANSVDPALGAFGYKHPSTFALLFLIGIIRQPSILGGILWNIHDRRMQSQRFVYHCERARQTRKVGICLPASQSEQEL